MDTPLAVLLRRYLASRCSNFERLAEEAGLPRNTVYRWTRGEVKKVRHWSDLAKAARALDLNRAETDALLAAGGHPPVETLLKRATDQDDRRILSRWTRRTPNNLPAPLTSFVGREHEIARLTSLLSSARLVTLTGPGGSGKTRLAIEAARTGLDDFEEVRFVDLASVRDPDLVPIAILQALGQKESPAASPIEALHGHLRDRTMLLVLDNFEQVVEAAPTVTELLRASRGLTALVTSRTRLNVRGEHALHVPPLALPCSPAQFERLARNPSVALFVDRARAADPSFTLTADRAPLVAEVCIRLDGLPLGIELAAARIRRVRMESMLEPFIGRLMLASDGPRDAPARQRTLRGTIAWSYDLLRPKEQAFFACLGVFAGGFTEDAAAAVFAAINLEQSDAPVCLDALVEQNLLRQIWDEAGEPRYEMLETTREYALERLKACGEEEAASSAASEYYAGLGERAEPEHEGSAYWLQTLPALRV